MFRKTTLLYLFLLIPFSFSINPSYANEQNSWTPVIDKFDWIQLTSGEWLKGNIKSYYNRKLEFDSNKLGLLSINGEDISFLESHITSTAHIEDHDVISGRIQLSADKVRIINNEKSQEFKREQLISFVSGDDSELNYWSGKLSLGLNFKRGNSETTDYLANANIKRRSSTTRLVMDYVGNVSINDSEKTINNHRLNVKFDYYKTRYFFFQPIFGEIYHDPFQNIEYRLNIGSGIGYTIIDKPSSEWIISGGPSYLKTEYITVQPGEKLVESTSSFVLSSHYDSSLTSSLDVILKYDVQLTEKSSGGSTHHGVFTLENELNGSLDLNLSIYWDRISYPTENETGETPEKNDFKFFVGIGYDF